jgi:hypothetical protein
MRNHIRRIAIIGACGAALAGVVAGTAQAAVPTASAPASGISETTAVLNGTVTTGGAAVGWQFQYGTSTTYGKTTPAESIAAGKGTVSVSATVTGLNPATAYHFRLATQSGNGSTYYPLVVTFGQDEAFTTSGPGKITIPGGTKLSSHKGVVSVTLTCASTQTCKGKLTLTVRVRIGKKFETLTFASQSFSIPAGGKLTLKPKLSKAALKLLKLAHGHHLKIKLSAKFSTGQPKLTKTVTLTLK